MAKSHVLFEEIAPDLMGAIVDQLSKIPYVSNLVDDRTTKTKNNKKGE